MYLHAAAETVFTATLAPHHQTSKLYHRSHRARNPAGSLRNLQGQPTVRLKFEFAYLRRWIASL